MALLVKFGRGMCFIASRAVFTCLQSYGLFHLEYQQQFTGNEEVREYVGGGCP